MNAEYEIFECLPDGSANWRDTAPDLARARLLLRKLTKDGRNECFAMCIATRAFVFRADGARSGPILANRVFQIAYTENLRDARAEVLRSCGYGVLSVMGNGAAKALLSMLQMRREDITFFMLGHAAPQSKRKEMVDWLRARYPSVSIIALNPPDEQIPGAQYNVLQGGPELWLPIVSTAA